MKKRISITKHHITKTTLDENSLNKESFVVTISALKKNAKACNVNIEDIDIMNAVNITASQFTNYFESDNAPNEVFMQLRSAFKEFLKGSYHVIQFIEELPDPLEEEGLE